MTKITIINCIIAAVCLIDGLVARQTELSTSTPCTNMQHSFKEVLMKEGMNICTNLKMCITNQTNSTESKEFINSMINMLPNLMKNFYEAMNCIKNPSYIVLVPCLYSMKNNISSQITQTMNAMHNITGIVYNINQCMKTKIHPLVNAISQIVSNIKQCLQSFVS